MSGWVSNTLSSEGTRGKSSESIKNSSVTKIRSQDWVSKSSPRPGSLREIRSRVLQLLTICSIRRPRLTSAANYLKYTKVRRGLSRFGWESIIGCRRSIRRISSWRNRRRSSASKIGTVVAQALSVWLVEAIEARANRLNNDHHALAHR